MRHAKYSSRSTHRPGALLSLVALAVLVLSSTAAAAGDYTGAFDESGDNALRSDIFNAIFTPAQIVLPCNGAAQPIHVDFSGTILASDGGHVKFKLTEINLNDVVLDVDITPTIAMPVGTEFSASVDFTLKALANGDLAGDNVSLAVITNLNSPFQVFFNGAPQSVVTGSAANNGHYQVGLQDVTNKLSTIVLTADADCGPPRPVPLLSTTNTAVLGIFILALGVAALTIRKRRTVAPRT